MAVGTPLASAGIAIVLQHQNEWDSLCLTRPARQLRLA